MPDGLIVKALSGYYYVLPDHAKSNEAPIQCRGRGILRKNEITPLVGDRVVYTMTDGGEGTVDEILPRTTELIRPQVANADTALLVFAVAEPDLSTHLLDKFLVHTEKADLQTTICISKSDLLHPTEAQSLVEIIENIRRIYEAIGYTVLTCSAKTGEGKEEILKHLAGKITVFSGQSGVGKSSLINAIIPNMSLETNEISNRLGRGKHTTRHVELIPLENGGWVFDTPGFSQLDFAGIETEGLGQYFVEFNQLDDLCKFRGCLHRNEPDCRVIEAVHDGRIAQSRYDHYLIFLQEISERKRRY
ncbi:MAG: ribosome small subunit-dependent GTPase A [Paenibacillaceae bacterium]